jgi:putative transposase
MFKFMSETIPLLPEMVYHIYSHANGSENLFRTEENYFYFLQKYGAHIYPIAETYAYCLMPNHFHFMIKIRSENEIVEFFKLKNLSMNLKKQQNIGLVVSQQFSNLFNAYCKSYNKMYNRKGSLFIPRFRRKHVDDENYFTQLIAYIHLNPVKHEFCKHVLDWKYSSIHAYYLNKKTKLNREYLYKWFGNKEELINFHESFMDNDLLFDF